MTEDAKPEVSLQAKVIICITPEGLPSRTITCLVIGDLDWDTTRQSRESFIENSHHGSEDTTRLKGKRSVLAAISVQGHRRIMISIKRSYGEGSATKWRDIILISAV
jgi:hypothetical protein